MNIEAGKMPQVWCAEEIMFESAVASCPRC